MSGRHSASGLTAATSINLTGLNAKAKANVNDWLASGYASGWKMTPSSFGGYVKARKEYKSISSLASIDSDGIYLWAGSNPLTIDEAGKGRFDNYKVVLVSSGTVNVGAGTFAPVGGSTAIVASTINFGDNTSTAETLI